MIVQSSTVYSTLELEANQVLLGYKKEWRADMQYSMDEP